MTLGRKESNEFYFNEKKNLITFNVDINVSDTLEKGFLLNYFGLSGFVLFCSFIKNSTFLIGFGLMLEFSLLPNF